MEVTNHPGYIGVFTRNQYPGAIPNGSRIVKVKEDPNGDLHAVGTKGIILGSISHPKVDDIGYFVEWDPHPKMASFVVGWKIRLA